ncbi:hypothetical protein K438DRAFT_1535879, partial [Mycena galopus ATCC 62051]
FHVQFAPGDFMSSLHASKVPSSATKICQFTGWIPGSRTRTSIQCVPFEHLEELNSDLVFLNHSCNPNVGLDLSSPIRDDWSVIAIKDIHQGDEMSWFYPSTEWDAWGGGFACRCGSEECIGGYRGAKELELATLSRYPLVQLHVLLLAAARD